MPRRLLFFLALLAALLAAAPARAQSRGPVEIQAPPRVLVGEPVQIGIVVHNARPEQPPAFPATPDLTIAYAAPMESHFNINGRSSSTFTYVYTLTAKRTGQLTIPPTDIVIDGRTYTTPATSIEAIEPAAGAGFTLALSAERSTAYVGQPVRVRLTWTLGRNVNGEVHVALPIDGAEADVFPGPETAAVRRGDPRAVTVVVNGTPTLALFAGNTLVVDQVVIPRHAGRVTVGPARVDYSAVIATRNDDPFDRLMGGRPVTERQFSTAPAVTLDARDLPAAGRPADFSGLVGSYAVTSSIDTPSVNIGDPIHLTVNVTGPYPLSLVPPLDLSRQPALAGKFRVPREPLLADLGTTTATFKGRIRARTPDAAAVGPIRLNYFDPDKGEYAVASAPPIPIKVSGGPSVKLPDVPEEPEPARTPDARTAIDAAPLNLDGSPFDLRASLRAPTTIALLAGPPLAVIALAGVRLTARRLRRDPLEHRRRRALASLRRALARAGRQPGDAALANLAHALANFAADLAGRPRDVVAAAEAAARFRALATPSAAQLADLLDLTDALRFGAHGSRPSTAELIARARTLATAAARERPAPLLDAKEAA